MPASPLEEMFEANYLSYSPENDPNLLLDSTDEQVSVRAVGAFEGDDIYAKRRVEQKREIPKRKIRKSK